MAQEARETQRIQTGVVIRGVRCTYQRTVGLPNYGNVKVGAEVYADVVQAEEGADLDAVYAARAGNGAGGNSGPSDEPLDPRGAVIHIDGLDKEGAVHAAMRPVFLAAKREAMIQMAAILEAEGMMSPEVRKRINIDAETRMDGVASREAAF